MFSEQKFRNKVKSIIDYALYMVDKRIVTLNKDLQLIRGEFYDNIIKRNIFVYNTFSKRALRHNDPFIPK
jgi:hypothetical protein